jgi:hypothetical protein
MTEAVEERANTVRTTDRTSLTMDERIGSLFQSDSLWSLNILKPCAEKLSSSRRRGSC